MSRPKLDWLKSREGSVIGEKTSITGYLAELQLAMMVCDRVMDAF